MMKFQVFLVVLIAALSMAMAYDYPGVNTGMEECDCPRSPVFLPTCGTNGVTYSSRKMLECAKDCLGLDDLKVKGDGFCW